MTDRVSKFVYVCMGIVFSASMLVVSCAGPSKMSVTPVSPSIDNTTRDLKASTDTIRGTTGKISDHANAGLAATPPAARPVLEPHWREILVQVGVQESVIKDLERSQSELAQTSQKATALEQAYTKEQELRKKAESDATKQLREKYTWASIACFGVFIVAVTLLVSGFGGGAFSKIAMGAAVASGIGLAVSIFLIQTVAIIPWIVGGIALIGGGLVVYRFVHKNKTITATTAAHADATQKVQALTTQTQALTEENQQLNQTATELVKTTEAAKPFMSLAGRKHVFGDGPVPGVIRSVQSEATRKLVSRVRGQMTNLAPSVPETIASDLASPDVVLPEVDDEEYHAEVMAYKPDTRSVRSRMARRTGRVIAGNSTVVVLR